MMAEAATFRRPTDRVRLYAWHARALAAMAEFGVDNLRDVNAQDPEKMPFIHEDDPQCGWFKAIVRRVAVPVPAKIFLKSVVDEDGELVEPELLQCEIGDEPFDVFEAWPKLCVRPITRAEHQYLMSVRAWAKSSAPDQPQARDGKPIDWLTVKIPAIPATPTQPKRKNDRYF